MSVIKNEAGDYNINFVHIVNPLIFNEIRLHQVGKKFCNSSTVIAPHLHSYPNINWFELTVVLDGKGMVSSNYESTEVSKGDIFLSFPYDIHEIVSDEVEPLKYSFISFSLMNDAYKQKLSNIMQQFYECKKRVFQDLDIPYFIDLIIEEMMNDSFEKHRSLSLYLEQLVIKVIRNFLYSRTDKVPNAMTKNEMLCYKIMRYVDTNIFSIHSLQELSDVFHYNYSYLTKVFQQTTKKTLSEYFSQQKLERAKILIKEGKLSFTKIAEQLNYASLYSFSKSFKQHFGLSPLDYKKLPTL